MRRAEQSSAQPQRRRGRSAVPTPTRPANEQTAVLLPGWLPHCDRAPASRAQKRKEGARANRKGKWRVRRRLRAGEPETAVRAQTAVSA